MKRTATKEPPNAYLDWRVWLAFLILFSISVPWYWPETHDQTLIGIPLWVLVTLSSSFFISALTAWLLLFRWPNSSKPEDDANE